MLSDATCAGYVLARDAVLRERIELSLELYMKIGLLSRSDQALEGCFLTLRPITVAFKCFCYILAVAVKHVMQLLLASGL